MTTTDKPQGLTKANFPDVDPGVSVKGVNIVVQLRTPARVSRGGIIFVDYSKEAAVDNEMVGKVVQIADGCFKSRSSGEPWAEGAWFGVGDTILVPKYIGARWRVRVPGTEDEYAHFVVCKELDVIAVVTNPDAMLTYLPQGLGNLQGAQ